MRNADVSHGFKSAESSCSFPIALLLRHYPVPVENQLELRRFIHRPTNFSLPRLSHCCCRVQCLCSSRRAIIRGLSTRRQKIAIARRDARRNEFVVVGNGIYLSGADRQGSILQSSEESERISLFSLSQVEIN